MYSPGTSPTMSEAYRGRKHPALCYHSAAPVLVGPVPGGRHPGGRHPGGRQARCLVCGTLGPVRQDAEGAGSVLRERGSSW